MKLLEELSGNGNRPPGLSAALLFLALLSAWLAMGPCLHNDFINWDETDYIGAAEKVR